MFLIKNEIHNKYKNLVEQLRKGMIKFTNKQKKPQAKSYNANDIYITSYQNREILFHYLGLMFQLHAKIISYYVNYLK